MREGWEQKTIDDIALVKGGKRVPKGCKLTSTPTPYPYITVSDFNDEGTVDTTDIKYIEPVVYEQIKNYTISSDDLYISIAGTIGKSGVVPPELNGANLTENACKLVFKNGIEQRYIYYFTISDSFITQAGINTRVAAQPKLALKRLKTICLPLPPLSEQKRIVSILDEAFAGIDQAIANTEKNLANARELFESYLNNVFTQKGEGWGEKKLTEILDFQPRNGWSPPAKNHSNSGTPVVTLSSVTGFVFDLSKFKYTSANTNKDAHYWLEEGCLLITRSNTPELVGHVAVCSELLEPTIYPDLIMKMKVNSSIALTKFVYYQLRSNRMRKLIKDSAHGANPTMKKINKGIVQSFPVSIPTLSEQKKIVDKLDSVLTESRNFQFIYQQKLNSLLELKQSILQKAFSGRLN